MAKEDISLPVEMGKLEIEPVKNKGSTDINPFFHSLNKRHLFTRTSIQSLRCNCITQKNKSSITICKKKNKILKKPVLKLLYDYCKDTEEPHRCDLYPSKLESSALESVNSENSILGALVDNCNQLRISSEREQAPGEASVSNYTRWWQKDLTCSSLQSRDSVSDKSRTGPSCSQEALNPPPCDVTIDELACYFETFVHIPKKMSSMAEMMYI